VLGCKNNESNKIEVNNNEISNNRFENNVFSFNFSDDWKITDTEKIEEGVYYMAVEKNGFDSSGLMTIVSFEELIDLDESIILNIEELQSNVVLRNFKFEPIKNDQFNGIASRSARFVFNTLGIKHEGFVCAFSSDNNSVVIIKQEALEDKKINQEGFETIEKSFEIK
jgi:hypothetical protein